MPPAALSRDNCVEPISIESISLCQEKFFVTRARLREAVRRSLCLLLCDIVVHYSGGWCTKAVGWCAASGYRSKREALSANSLSMLLTLWWPCTHSGPMFGDDLLICARWLARNKGNRVVSLAPGARIFR